jgi:hypothetical protein
MGMGSWIWLCAWLGSLLHLAVDWVPSQLSPTAHVGAEVRRELPGSVFTVRSSVGHHTRLMTARGPVHLWRPAGYDPRTAGTIVYVHGYYTDVDSAWLGHDLEGQFSRSGRNALYICPEAPSAFTDPVSWESLTDLFSMVEAHGRVDIPSGPVVAVAHSGGFRTLVPWLGSGLVDSVILVDALYGQEDAFVSWLRQGGNEARHLTLVSTSMTRRIQNLMAPIADRVVFDAIPAEPQTGATSRQHRLRFYRSQYGHMELITEGKALPVLIGNSLLSPVHIKG